MILHDCNQHFIPNNNLIHRPSSLMAWLTCIPTISSCTVVRVRFEQPEYTFSEGSNEGTVCLRKDLETTVDVSVSVLTENGSALSEHTPAQAFDQVVNSYILVDIWMDRYIHVDR